MDSVARVGLYLTLGLDHLLGEPEGKGTLWEKLGVRGRGFVRVLVALTLLTAFFALMAVAREYDRFNTLMAGVLLYLDAGATLLLLTGLIQCVGGRSWSSFSSSLRIGFVVVITPLFAAPIFFVMVSADALIERLERSEWYKTMDPGYAALYSQAEVTREALRSCSNERIPIRCECDTLPKVQQKIEELKKITTAHPGLVKREMTFPIPGRPNVREILTAERLFDLVELREELCASRGANPRPPESG